MAPSARARCRSARGGADLGRVADALDHPLADTVYWIVGPFLIAPFGAAIALDAPGPIVDVAFWSWLLLWGGGGLGIGWMRWRRARRWHALARAAGWRPSWRADRIGASYNRVKRMPDGREVFALYGRDHVGDILLYARVRIDGTTHHVVENIVTPRDGAELDRLALELSAKAQKAEETGIVPRPASPRKSPSRPARA